MYISRRAGSYHMCLVSHIARDLVTNVDDGPRGFFEFVMPPVDIVEDGAELIIRIDLPGFEKNDINIRIVENILSISAKREAETQQWHSIL